MLGPPAPGARRKTNQMDENSHNDGEHAAALRELIARAKAKDDAALEQLIRAYQQRIAAFVVSVVGKDDDWQDLCQQIFVKMVLGLRRLDNPGAFEPWLMRIARNSCFDYLRRRRTRRFLTPWQPWHDTVPSEPPSDEAEALSLALDTAIGRLPAEQRELVTMVRSRHWTYEALAQTAGISLAALKTRLFRARRRLRELMTEGEAGNDG